MGLELAEIPHRPEGVRAAMSNLVENNRWMLPNSGLWPVKIIWLKNNLAVSLSGLESNFYGGSDSTISLSSMNTNRCALE
ncbi:MAG: hypothetical protein DSY97_06435 [SAR324 cluster bacterium]|uniref:Uncharacterized protein n=1 Tax=SAR324 cluster bacterium TaxID=2024889 RepID=A0A432G5J6_9DELT|nr:MAG: hypothetical protein DSY97_06435 [SAR324 cluster bacterium]